jgi:hypothetical protein
LYNTLLVKAGRQVRTVAVTDRMNPERLTRILNARIEWARRHDRGVPAVSVDTAAGLSERFGPGILTIQYELHKTFQKLTARTSHVEV